MPYLAPVELFENLTTIKERYLKRAELTEKQLEQDSGITTLIGATNTTARRLQLSIIKRLASLENPINATSDAETSIGRYQFMVGLLMSINKQIESEYGTIRTEYGHLHTTIRETLQISSDNDMDAKTLRACTDRIINTNIFYLNQELLKKKLPLLEDEQLDSLQHFARSLRPKSDKKYAHPVATTMASVAKIPCSLIGIGLGWVAFDMLGKSAFTTPFKLILNKSFGLVLGCASSNYGPVLFAGRAADRAVNIAFEASGAYFGAELFGRAGESAGYLAGYTIEFAIAATGKLIRKLNQLLNEMAESEELYFRVNLLTGELVLLDQYMQQLDIQQMVQNELSHNNSDRVQKTDASEPATLLTLTENEIGAIFALVEASKRSMEAEENRQEEIQEGEEEHESLLAMSPVS